MSDKQCPVYGDACPFGSHTDYGADGDNGGLAMRKAHYRAWRDAQASAEDK
jgi:hypothetical protein